MRTTEIDPEVQIIFGSGSLLEEGDAVEIGETPIHPPDLAAQLPCRGGAEPPLRQFRPDDDVPEYQESEEYTMTIVVDEHGEEGEHPHDDHDR